MDKPGVMAKISSILAAANIGISSVIQPEGHEGESVPLILMLHDATNGAVAKALDQIGKLPVVKAKPVMIRVELRAERFSTEMTRDRDNTGSHDLYSQHQRPVARRQSARGAARRAGAGSRALFSAKISAA